jgi:hypothetical protein
MALSPPPLLTVTDDFTSSFAGAHQYPLNLVQKNCYSATLRAYNRRLERASRKLFIAEERLTEVAFRDFDETISSKPKALLFCDQL